MSDHLVVDRDALHHVVRDVAARATVAVGLAGIALIHLLDSIGKWSETRYLFWMYVALMIGSLVTAGAVLFLRTRLVWPAAAGLAASALVGFIINRTVGMPNATDDIGNWIEPLGLASMFVEATVLVVSVATLAVSARATTAAADQPLAVAA